MISERGAKQSQNWGNLGFLTGCALGQMLLQFFFLTLVARWFGVSVEVDAFNAALVVPVSIATLLAAPLPLVMVPEMVRLRTSGNSRSAWRLAVAVMVSYLLLATGCAFVLNWQPTWAAGFLFGGFEPQVLEDASRYLRILAWLVPLNGLITILQATHHAVQRFRIAAFSGLFGVFVPIGYVVFRESATLRDFSVGTVLGAVAAVVTLLIPLGAYVRQARQEQVKDDGGEANLRWGRLVWMLTPLMLAGLYSRTDPLIDRVIASYLADGSVAQLGYAQRLIMALATLAGSGLSIVIFPRLSAVGRWEDRRVHGELLSSAWRFLLMLVVPVTAAVLVFAEPIVRDLFERGAFDASDTQAVATLLRWMLGVFVAGALGEIATKSLYARGATRMPALISMIGFTLGLGLKYWWARQYGIAGVAAANSTYYLFNLSCFLGLIYYVLGRSAFAGVGHGLVCSLVASVAAIGVGYVPVMLMPWGGGFVGGAVGLIVYLVVQRWLKNEFLVASASMDAAGQGLEVEVTVGHQNGH